MSVDRPQNMGASASAETGSRASTEPQERDLPFAEEFPHLNGCLQMVASYIVASFVLGGIAAIGGLSAMYWFGGGFLVSAGIFLWEAGRNAIATEAGTAATENTGAVHEGAGPQDIAQGDNA